MNRDQVMQAIIASSRRLSETDPRDPGCLDGIRELDRQVTMLATVVGQPRQAPVDPAQLGEQIEKMRAAALTPAANYRRIVSILSSLKEAHVLASRPQNRPMMPKLASIVAKVAGIFSQVDTIEDLNKPLEQIEKAVHSLYGDQSKNSTFYFDRRGKGHHGEKQD